MGAVQNPHLVGRGRGPGHDLLGIHELPRAIAPAAVGTEALQAVQVKNMDTGFEHRVNRDHPVLDEREIHDPPQRIVREQVLGGERALRLVTCVPRSVPGAARPD